MQKKQKSSQVTNKHLRIARRGNRSGVVYKVVPPVPVARTRNSYEPSESSPRRLTRNDVVLVVVFCQLESPSLLHSTSNVWKSFLCSSVRTGRLTFTVLVAGPVVVSSTTRPRVQTGHTSETVASENWKWTKSQILHGLFKPLNKESVRQSKRSKPIHHLQWDGGCQPWRSIAKPHTQASPEGIKSLEMENVRTPVRVCPSTRNEYTPPSKFVTKYGNWFRWTRVICLNGTNCLPVLSYLSTSMVYSGPDGLKSGTSTVTLSEKKVRVLKQIRSGK